jgi:hypothetical protein
MQRQRRLAIFLRLFEVKGGGQPVSIAKYKEAETKDHERRDAKPPAEDSQLTPLVYSKQGANGRDSRSGGRGSRHEPDRLYECNPDGCHDPWANGPAHRPSVCEGKERADYYFTDEANDDHARDPDPSQKVRKSRFPIALWRGWLKFE